MKKFYVLTFCLLISVFNVFAQQNDVYEIVEEMPEFPGGITKMNEFLGNNIIYPEYAVENNIEGRVIVEFVVNTDGTITGLQVKRSVHELLDNEALRVVKSMPKWKPGKNDGKLVRVKYTLPITFNLEIKPVFASDEERVEFFVRSHVDVNTNVEITEIQPMERFLFSIVKFRYQTPEIFEDKIEENKKIFQYIESLSNETKISYFIPVIVSFKEQNEDAWTPAWYLALMDENKNIIEMISYYP
jgi:TonB family protein